MVYFVLCIGIIVLDFLVKLWAKTDLSQIGSIPVWKGVFHLTYVENKGAAFGIMQNKVWFFVTVALVAIPVIVYVFRKYQNRSKILNLGLCFILAGAVGNMMDRINLGFVVDFLDFRIIDFPVFNIADIFVCVGAGLIAIFVIFIEEKLKSDPKEAEENAD